MGVNFREHTAKGITRALFDDALQGEPIHVHISELEPGTRSHPPHRHGGYEAFYMLEGEGTVEIEGETTLLAANEVAVIDPQKLHGIFNASSGRIRYMVILTKDPAASSS